MNTMPLFSFLKHVSILFPTFLILFTVRGFFQALAAYWVGDDTAREEGFLTLNPLAHVDVFGVLLVSFLFAAISQFEGIMGHIVSACLLVLIFFAGIRPYYPAPVDAYNFRWPRLGVVVTTLSVTFSYCFITVLSAYALAYSHYFFGGASAVFRIVQLITTSIIQWAMFWAVISLIPIPPFDASALLPVFFGDVGQKVYDFLEQYTLLIFLGLFFIPGVSELFLQFISAARVVLYQWLMALVWVI